MGGTLLELLVGKPSPTEGTEVGVGDVLDVPNGGEGEGFRGVAAFFFDAFFMVFGPLAGVRGGRPPV